jgi:hypothetical protein
MTDDEDTTTAMLARADLAIAKIELETRQRSAAKRKQIPVVRGNHHFSAVEYHRIEYLKEKIKELEAKQQEKTQ